MLRVKENKGKNDWWGGRISSATSSSFHLVKESVLPFSKDSNI